MTLQQLETFLWVATLASFRKAAERLNTTQPAISARIATLEDQLEVQLFERDSGKVRLTTKGQELLPQADRIVRAAGKFREMAGGDAQFAGMLRLGVSETVVHTLLPVFLKVLHATLPRIDVDVSVDVTANLRNALIERALDLAFLMGPISEYSIENRPLATYPLVWSAAPQLMADHGSAEGLIILSQLPILTYARNTRPFLTLVKGLRDRGIEDARLFPSSSLSACLKMALDGIGIATLPRAMIEAELRAGTLVEVPLSWVPEPLVFTASYRGDLYNPLAERVAGLASDIGSG